MTLSEVHLKCPVILICPPGDAIEVDWLTRGQVRLLGKVPGCRAGSSGGKSLWTNSTVKFLTHL